MKEERCFSMCYACWESTSLDHSVCVSALHESTWFSLIILHKLSERMFWDFCENSSLYDFISYWFLAGAAIEKRWIGRFLMKWKHFRRYLVDPASGDMLR